MAYSVSEAFREQCYSGSSLYSCRLIIGNTTVPMSQIASITISSPIIDSSSETFYIGSFISQKLTIDFKNLDGINTTSGTQVELYISQNVNGTDIEVPIGKYLIDESPEDYYKSTTIECLDYAIKFATNVDYSPAFVDNKITIDNLLQWLCTHYGVTLGSYPNTNGSVEIGTYDSTVSGKRWISYIAEIKGCNAKMDRLGQLTLVPVKSTPAVTIDALKSKSWELGEKYEIKTVTYFDATRNYTYTEDLTNVNYNNNPLYYNGKRIGYIADRGNTLIIRQDNPFVVNESVVQNIFNVVDGLKIWSLTCENYGDISLDAWDILEYTLGNDTYYTLNNNTITYAMTIMSKIETKIPTKQQQITTNVVEGNEEQRLRRIGSEVNNLDAEIRIYAEEQDELSQKVTNLQITTDNIQTNVASTTQSLTNQITTLQSSTSYQINAITSQIEDGVPKVKTSTGYTFDDLGFQIQKEGKAFGSLMDDEHFEIKNSGQEKAFFGFDAVEQKYVSRIEELEARRITTGRHRCEPITENLKPMSAFYYVGGGD